MPRKGWTQVEVPSGWIQLIRGPRPKSVQWPKVVRMLSAVPAGTPQCQRVPRGGWRHIRQCEEASHSTVQGGQARRLCSSVPRGDGGVDGGAPCGPPHSGCWTVPRGGQNFSGEHSEVIAHCGGAQGALSGACERNSRCGLRGVKIGEASNPGPSTRDTVAHARQRAMLSGRTVARRAHTPFPLRQKCGSCSGGVSHLPRVHHSFASVPNIDPGEALFAIADDRGAL